TSNDIYQTIKNYRTTNPDGQIVLIGHSLGGKNVMEAALSVANDREIENKAIDLVITLEAASAVGRGKAFTTPLGDNVLNVLNYNAAQSGLSGGGGRLSGRPDN